MYTMAKETAIALIEHLDAPNSQHIENPWIDQKHKASIIIGATTGKTKITPPQKK
jgi:hypothetical protein